MKVARSQLGGLSVIAKASLAAGELIYVLRPLAYVWGALQSRSTERTVDAIVNPFGVGTGESYSGPPPPTLEIALHARLLTGCGRDSRLRRALHKLFDGTSNGTSDDSESPILPHAEIARSLWSASREPSSNTSSVVQTASV